MKKLFSVFLSLLLCLAGMIYPAQTYAIDSCTKLDNILKAYPEECSVIIYTEDDGTLYSYHAKNKLYSASIIKLTYAVYVCQQIEEGIHSLDDTMVYTSAWGGEGSGIIQYQPYGTSYTVRELLDYSLRYSDNVAYFMLTYLFDRNDFNKMIKKWGYDFSISYDSAFTDVNAEFMKKSMVEMYNHRNDGECWEVCWDALMGSETSVVRNMLNKYDIAVKFGSMDGVYHEVCYVESDTPYILVVLSSISDTEQNGKLIRNAALYADDIVKEHYAGRKKEIDSSKLKNDINEYAVFLNDGISKMNNEQRKKADVNGDGVINNDDVTLILSYYSYASSGGILSQKEFFASYQLA
ncbi:MAG: serine hydrolase [Muribaculaceae bacterium]|nr:serine hydrolase [Alistipes senegalensis]MCM1473936.1 serine hydrolase [Muribaculaceae bacterium]